MRKRTTPRRVDLEVHQSHTSIGEGLALKNLDSET